jgi:hypothetical protein
MFIGQILVRIQESQGRIFVNKRIPAYQSVCQQDSRYNRRNKKNKQEPQMEKKDIGSAVHGSTVQLQKKRATGSTFSPGI